jgi:nucleoside-diphosphate-sugar epimerase
METMMSKGKVTVLGSNGHIGNAVMWAFQEAGWTVTGLGRSNRKPVPGTRFVQGDANDIDVVRAAIADADVVVNALHLPYDKWGNGAAETQLRIVLDALAGSGKTLMFPGTIYNYRATDRTLSPDLPQDGEKARGRIRMRLETMIRDGAERGDYQAIILRAGDFFGPGERGEWFEQAMLMDRAKGQVHHLGDMRKRHSWAYLPDLGRAFTVLAERRAEFGRFENFHFAGHWVSHHQIMAAIQSALGRPMKVTPFPWWGIRLVGLVNPIMRDLHEMRYIWSNEMELVDPRLDKILGSGFTTPFEVAVKATVDELVGAKAAA